MTGPRPERRLAAILAADVVGYSALVEQDEAGTLGRLATLRTRIIEPLLAEHRGRLVKLMGDGVLAEFASVVDAVACAVAVQDGNPGGPPLRIGVNPGDVDGLTAHRPETGGVESREFERAAHHADQAVALNPNDGDAVAYRAHVLCFLGRAEEALANVRRALALTPFHPNWYWNLHARALHETGCHDEASMAFERMDRRHFYHDARLATCHAAVGRTEEARRAVARALAAKPDFSSAAWTATLPFRNEAARERLRAELVAAGLPP